MNVEQAKSIPLEVILHRLGHEPSYAIGENDYWYLSPFRQEAVPSFHINRAKNIWFDFGVGGGNIINLIQQCFDIPESDVSGALKQIESVMGGVKAEEVVITPPVVEKEPREAIEVTGISSLRNRVLMRYLREERGISVALARPYLKEIYYTRDDKRYFALAFGNKSGGYELRNKYYKGTYGRKDVSLVKKEGSESVSVFEGFMDFLSALTYYGKPITSSVIVMNGTGLQERTVEAIKEMGASKVYLYTQRDKQGITARDYITRELKGVEVSDKSNLYEGYSDFNEFLVERKKGQSSSVV